MGFVDVILNSGLAGVLCWLAIAVLLPVGSVLGVVSIVASSLTKQKQYPLAFKAMVPVALAAFFVGAAGSLYGISSAIQAVESTRGAETAQLMAIGISNSLYSLAVTLSCLLFWLLLMAVSVLILHIKQPVLLAEPPLEERETN